MAQFVKNAVFRDHRVSIPQGDGLSQPSPAMADPRLHPRLRAQAPFPQPMHKRLPRRFALPIGDLPIQDLPLATAIRPQPQRDQHYHLLSLALLALTLAFVQLDGLRLGLLAQPNAIELHHGRPIDDRVTARLPKPRLYLIDAVLDAASAHTAP